MKQLDLTQSRFDISLSYSALLESQGKDAHPGSRGPSAVWGRAHLHPGIGQAMVTEMQMSTLSRPTCAHIPYQAQTQLP